MKLAYFLTIIFSLITSNSLAQEHHHHHGGNDDVEDQSIVSIMQGMNENLGNLSKAIMLEDYKLITLSAHKIANHPGIKDMDKLFKRLGDKKEGFIKCDTAVHNLAVEVAKAGKEKDMTKVLNKHSAMLTKAVECHSKYRE